MLVVAVVVVALVDLVVGAARMRRGLVRACVRLSARPKPNARKAEAEAHNWCGEAVGVGENGAKDNGQAPSGANTRAAEHRGMLGRLDVAKSIAGTRTTNAALASAIAKQKRASARSGRLKMGRSNFMQLSVGTISGRAQMGTSPNINGKPPTHHSTSAEASGHQGRPPCLHSPIPTPGL